MFEEYLRKLGLLGQPQGAPPIGAGGMPQVAPPGGWGHSGEVPNQMGLLSDLSSSMPASPEGSTDAERRAWNESQNPSPPFEIPKAPALSGGGMGQILAMLQAGRQDRGRRAPFTPINTKAIQALLGG